MLTNYTFFKTCFNSELKALIDVIIALPEENRQYRPHGINRSAEELVGHILAHITDMKTILENTTCNETPDTIPPSFAEAALQLNYLWANVQLSLAQTDNTAWETQQVALLINQKHFITLPRFNMMWFFLFDIIHHRGQLSSYIRPMGGAEVPAIYGYSADTAAA